MSEYTITNELLLSLGPWLHDFKLPEPLHIPIEEKFKRRIWQRREHLIPSILAQYPEGLDGLTVCDLGANAGFWARQFADLGAKVVCVEPRIENIRQAEAISKVLGEQGLQWVHATAQEFLNKNGDQYDIVLILGLLYHLPNPYEFLNLAAQHSKDLIVVDSNCINDDTPFLEIRKEVIKHLSQAIIETILLPSRGAIYWMLRGCEFHHIMELSNVGDLPEDYLSFERCTFIIRRHKEIIKPMLEESKPFLRNDELCTIYPPLERAFKKTRSPGSPRTRDFYKDLERKSTESFKGM